MSTYYKKIDGRNYDRAMLEKAENSIKGKGDGRISLADARNLIKLIKDGGRITDIEKRTLAYILEKYTFTDTALKYIEKTLSETLAPEPERADDIQTDKVEVKKDTSPALSFIRRKTTMLISLLIILIIIVIFAVLKIFNKNHTSYMPVVQKKDEAVKTQINEPVVSGEESKVVKSVEPKPDQKGIKNHDNEYVVKENDNLIKISQELYNDYRKWQDIYKLNKDKVDKPSVIFPGQVLILPEKQNK